MGYQTSQRLIKDRLDLIKNSEEIRFSIFRDWMNRWYSTLTFSVVKFKKKQPKSEIVALEKKVFILIVSPEIFHFWTFKTKEKIFNQKISLQIIKA
jgi:hypothetical protein